MLAYAEEAREFVGERDAVALADDRMRAMATVRAVEVVGEAAGRLSDEVRASLPHIDFRPAVAMRHRLIHGYSKVRLEIVVQTVREDFPRLIVALRAALAGKLPDE